MQKRTKTLKNILLYGIPITMASLLPINKANGQMIKIDHPTKRELNGQMKIERPNALYLVLQPGDLGLGIRYDRRISHKLGAYSSLSRGNYKLGNGDYIDSHNKIGFGGLFYPKKNFGGSQSFFSFGLSHHTYGEKSYESGAINEKVFKPISLEAGTGVNIGNFGGALSNFTGAIRFDLFKREGSWDLGFSF